MFFFSAFTLMVKSLFNDKPTSKSSGRKAALTFIVFRSNFVLAFESFIIFVKFIKIYDRCYCFGCGCGNYYCGCVCSYLTTHNQNRIKLIKFSIVYKRFVHLSLSVTFAWNELTFVAKIHKSTDRVSASTANKIKM